MRGHLAVALALALGACDLASSNPGLEAVLQIPGAQYRPGPFPVATGGPAAVAIAPRIAIAVTGHVTGNTLRGSLEGTATGAILGIVGYDGAWILPAELPDFDTPGLATVHASFALAPDFPQGAFTIQLAASSEAGVGAPVTTDLIAVDDVPESDLVVELAWDGRADLDVHLVDPLGHEAWADEPNTHKPPGPGEPPENPLAYLEGGRLDHDANKDCHRDGRPRERILWSRVDADRFGVEYVPPPPGLYTVRVDTRALCGDAAAAWSLTVYSHHGDPARVQVFGRATGVSTADDAEQPHGRGAGVLAVRFAR